jgi:hypothetical protein
VFLGGFSNFMRNGTNGNETNFIFYAATTFFISYLIEFINSRKEEQEVLPNLGKLMFAPYARIIPMHLTIILGGFIGAAGSFFSADTNLAIIVLFTSIKTVVDLITHSADIGKLIKQPTAISD